MIPIIGPLIEIANSLVSAGAGSVKAWQDRLTQRNESKLKIEEAKVNAEITRLQKMQEGEIEWDNIQATNMGQSWKDEFYAIIFAIPLVMCFIPQLAGYVKEGFAVLEQTPDFYQAALALILGSTFAVKQFIRIRNSKKSEDDE